MLNRVRIVTYLILISFFSSVIYNAFLFSKGLALYKYLFGGITSNIEIIAYYLIKSLPAILINFFIIWILKNILDIERPWLVMPFYIVFFLASETLFFFILNRAFFIENNNIYHYLLSFFVYSISLWSLSFPSFNNSSVSTTKNNEKTEL
jgi:hypothetical protein